MWQVTLSICIDFVLTESSGMLFGDEITDNFLTQTKFIRHADYGMWEGDGGVWLKPDVYWN